MGRHDEDDFCPGDIVKNSKTGQLARFVAPLKSRQYVVRLLPSEKSAKFNYDDTVKATPEEAATVLKKKPKKEVRLHLQHEDDYSVLTLNDLLPGKEVRIKLNNNQLGALLGGQVSIMSPARVVSEGSS